MAEELVFYNEGLKEILQENWSAALTCFQKAIEKDPQDADAWSGLGYCYGNIGHHQDAIESYKQAIRIKPDFAEAHGNLGVAYDKLGRSQDEIESHNQAIRIKPDFAGAHLEWLRWLAILPAAIGAYCGVQALIILASWLNELELGRPMMPDIIYQLVNTVAASVAFVWIGSKTAPKYHFVVGIILAVVFTAFGSIITTIGVANKMYGSPAWLIFTTVLSVISALITALCLRDKESPLNNHTNETGFFNTRQAQFH